MKWILFSDGACSGNPGKGGWGLIVANDLKVQEFAGSESHTTNNRMELDSAISGLEIVLKDGKPGDQIILHSDSSYVLEGIKTRMFRWSKNGWITSAGSEVANRDLWERALVVVQDLKDKKIELRTLLVPGHSGIPANERVDQIAVALCDGKQMQLYSGPRSEYDVSFDLTPFSPVYLSFVDGKLSRHSTWAECSAATQGKKGAKFKKVVSLKEEKQILDQWGLKSI